MRKICITLFVLQTFLLAAQQKVSIALIHDAKAEVGLLKHLEQSAKAEIGLLLQHRYELEFTDYYGNRNAPTLLTQIQSAYQDHDVVITLGILGSQVAVAQNSFPEPTIAATISDTKLSGLSKTPEGTSGIDNLVFIESPFDIARDLQTLQLIRPFQHLAIVYDSEMMAGSNNFLTGIIQNNLADASINVDFYQIGELIAGNSNLKPETQAVYLLPILNDSAAAQTTQVFEKVNSIGIPSSALFGDIGVDGGALIGYESDQNLDLIPRRIALNTMKIVEGQNAKDIPVAIETYNDNLLINMATARQIGIYPNFDLMAKSTLINIADNPTERQLTLQSAIAEALRTNLDYQLSALDVEVAQTEVGIALSDQLPQADVSTSFSFTDELTTLSRQGAQGRSNWIGSASISQVIFSEPLLANIAIQKLLKKGAEYEMQQLQYDLIVDIAEAYLNILQAETNLNIQQKNVEVTKENYDISKSKNAIGYAGAADLYRWEAELATKNIDLNAAFATVKQAKFRLNQLLNRPINEPFSVKKETLEESMLLVTDGRLENIDDYGDFEKFASFIVDFSKNRLPTLDLLDNNIKLQERWQLSRERTFFLPSLALTGSAYRVFKKYNVPEQFPSQDNKTTWDIGVGASYPIFQGNLRSRDLEKAKVQLEQLHLTKKNVQNQLELAIRSNMENIYVSFGRMDLSREASNAANKNFDIIQDSYNQGQVNITTLIDAQNNTLRAELNATNAVYQFILDFLTLERSIGFFYFLSSEEERNDFFQAANQYLISGQ